MSKRHPNPRLAKIHRNYTVEEVARLYGIHRHTVREWVKRGLPTSDDQRPMLILGRDLVAFLRARRARNKCTCKPGEFYCLRCRVPKSPALRMAEYWPSTATLGNLTAICPDCTGMMNRRTSVEKLRQILDQMDITMPQAVRHIGGVRARTEERTMADTKQSIEALAVMRRRTRAQERFTFAQRRYAACAEVAPNAIHDAVAKTDALLASVPRLIAAACLAHSRHAEDAAQRTRDLLNAVSATRAELAKASAAADDLTGGGVINTEMKAVKTVRE